MSPSTAGSGRGLQGVPPSVRIVGVISSFGKSLINGWSKKAKDPFTTLPDEILDAIFELVDGRISFYHLALVSRRFNRLATPRLYSHLAITTKATPEPQLQFAGLLFFGRLFLEIPPPRLRCQTRGPVQSSEMPLRRFELLHRALQIDPSLGSLCQSFDCDIFDRDRLEPRMFAQVFSCLSDVKRLRLVEHEVEGTEPWTNSLWVKAALILISSKSLKEIHLLSFRDRTGSSILGAIPRTPAPNLRSVTIRLPKLERSSNIIDLKADRNVLRCLVEWSSGLKSFSGRFAHEYWEIGMIRSCLLPRASTLESISLADDLLHCSMCRLVSVDDLAEEMPHRTLQEFDLSVFWALQSLTITPQLFGFDTTLVGNLLAPRLRKLTLDCPNSAPEFLAETRHYHDKIVEWTRELALEAVSRKAALNEICINLDRCVAEAGNHDDPFIEWDLEWTDELMESSNERIDDLKKEFRHHGIEVSLNWVACKNCTHIREIGMRPVEPVATVGRFGARLGAIIGNREVDLFWGLAVLSTLSAWYFIG